VKANPKDQDSRAMLLMATLKLNPSDADRKALTEIMKPGKVAAATKEAYRGFETREKILAFNDDYSQAMRAQKDKDAREAESTKFKSKAYGLFKNGLAPAESGIDY